MSEQFSKKSNMVGTYKKYSEKLAKADRKARIVFKAWLKSLGYQDSDIIERENPDFLIDNKYYVEIELSDCWNVDRFPENQFPSCWRGAHVLERKRKNKIFANQQGKNCFFVMFRSDLRKAIITHDKFMTEDKLVPNPNKYRKNGDEYVFWIKHNEYIFRDVEGEINERNIRMSKKDWLI